MGILKEYKFFIIISVIFLAGLAIYFLNNQNHFYYNQYISKVKENYLRVKQLDSGEFNLYYVFNLTDTTLKGLQGQMLFGKNYNGKDVYVTDNFNQATGGKYMGPITPGMFGLSVVYTNDIDGDTTQSYKKIKDTTSNDKIWDFNKNGRLIFIFNSENEVTNIINSYIPDGKIIPMTDLSNGITKNVGLMIGF